MRRTQLYLDEDLWNGLRAQARKQGTTVSNLVRQAARERYLGNFEERKKAMQAFVGIGKAHQEKGDSTAVVRRLRRGTRLERFEAQ